MKRFAWIVACALGAACTPAPQPVMSSDANGTVVAASASAASPAIPVASASASTTPSASAAPAPSGAVQADTARDKRIQEKFGRICRLERTCGALWGIDCEAASDGPYYYVKAETLEKVSECGGFCRGGRCTTCPPKEWSCATY